MKNVLLLSLLLFTSNAFAWNTCGAEASLVSFEVLDDDYSFPVLIAVQSDSSDFDTIDLRVEHDGSTFVWPEGERPEDGEFYGMAGKECNDNGYRKDLPNYLTVAVHELIDYGLGWQGTKKRTI